MRKRYEVLSSYLGMYNIFDNEKHVSLSYIEIVDLLNRLDEENKQLRRQKNGETI